VDGRCRATAKSALGRVCKFGAARYIAVRDEPRTFDEYPVGAAPITAAVSDGILTCGTAPEGAAPPPGHNTAETSGPHGASMVIAGGSHGIVLTWTDGYE
jgi:hypothetical protein